MVKFRLDTDTEAFDAVSFDGYPTVTRAIIEEYIAYLDETSEVNDWILKFDQDGSAYIWRHQWEEGQRELFGEVCIAADASGNYRMNLSLLGLELIEVQ